MYLDSKRQHGQYYTVENPFNSKQFYEWMMLIKDRGYTKVIEPFAGANNIINLVSGIDEELGIGLDWGSYDIEPSSINNYGSVEVIQRDTIEDFPVGYDIAITNPPYLAKNSAKRRGLTFPTNYSYDDLYKVALHIMLENCQYVAAIIPESFITSGLFIDRLRSVTSLNMRMFDDTSHPVSLALFTPQEEALGATFEVYNMQGLIGDYVSLMDSSGLKYYKLEDVKFNNPKGRFSGYLVDNTSGPSICFGYGDEIDESEIKVSSRARVKFDIDDRYDTKEVIDLLNSELTTYRERTGDVFLTSFKGLRRDGKYRRRLDFKTIRELVSHVCNIIDSKGGVL